MRASSGEAPTARKLAQKVRMSKTRNPTNPTSRSGLACRSWCSASSMPSDVADSAGVRRATLDPSPRRVTRISAARASLRNASVAAMAPAATAAGSAVRSNPPPPGRTPVAKPSPNSRSIARGTALVSRKNATVLRAISLPPSPPSLRSPRLSRVDLHVASRRAPRGGLRWPGRLRSGSRRGLACSSGSQHGDRSAV